MKTVIHLKTARVYATNEDSTPKIERTTVKLEDGDNFLKFVKHMHLRGFIKSEPPFVDKVLRLKGKEYVEIDKKHWQDIVEKALADKKPMESKIDYKHLSEKQTKEISQLKANNDSFEERLKKLEQNKTPDLPKELKYKNYTGCVDYSEEDKVYYGKILNISDLVTFEGETLDKLKEGFEYMVDEYIKDLEYEKTKSKEPKSETRKALELKATELKIKFRDNIGDAKLLEKIKLIEPEYKA